MLDDPLSGPALADRSSAASTDEENRVSQARLDATSMTLSQLAVEAISAVGTDAPPGAESATRLVSGGSLKPVSSARNRPFVTPRFDDRIPLIRCGVLQNRDYV
jgi:hypothetical protein